MGFAEGLVECGFCRLVPAKPLPSRSRPLPEGSAQSWLRQMVFADHSALASAGQSSVQLTA